MNWIYRVIRTELHAKVILTTSLVGLFIGTIGGALAAAKHHGWTVLGLVAVAAVAAVAFIVTGVRIDAAITGRWPFE